MTNNIKRPTPKIKGTLALALAVIEAHPGWYIFPITRYQKFPPCFEDNLALASNDPKQIEAWHRKWQACNWGIALAKSRLIVVDVDEKEGKHGRDTYVDLDLDHGFPDTLTVSTPSGGHHYYYQIPDDDTEHKHRCALGKAGFGRDVDVPNYVLIPGCRISGGTYTVERDIVVAETPAFFWSYIKEKPKAVVSQIAGDVELDAEPNVKWFIDYLKFDAPPSIEGSGGEKVLLDVFGVGKDHGVSMDRAIELVDEHYNCAPTCDPLWLNGEGPDADRLDVKARNAYGYLTENAPGERTPEFEFGGDALPELTADEIALREKRQREKRGELEPLVETPPVETAHPQDSDDDGPDKMPDPFHPVKFGVDWVVENWVWIIEAERFMHRKTGAMWNRKQFDSRYNFLGRGSSISGELFKTKGRIRRFIKLKYIPGAVEVLGDDYNAWKPSDIVAAEGNTAIWNEHINYPIPDDAEREYVLNWLAWIIQNLGVKPNQALLIVGTMTGTGKSIVFKIMEKIIGKLNTKRPKNSSLKGEFNGWALHCKLCIIEELMQIGRREVANELRDIITEPTIEVNIKNVPAFEIDSYTAMGATTNHRDALPLEENDRRWAAVSAVNKKRNPAYYKRLFDGLVNNPAALAAVAWELDHRPLNGFAPFGDAPVFASKETMIDRARPLLQSWLNENRDEYPLNLKLVTVEDVIETYPHTIPDHERKKAENTILDFLRDSLDGERFEGQHYIGSRRKGESRRVGMWGINGGRAEFAKMLPAERITEYVRRKADVHKQPSSLGDIFDEAD